MAGLLDEAAHIKQMAVSGESGDVSGQPFIPARRGLHIFSKATVLRT